MKFVPSPLPPENSTVLVGMSGGVDSTLTVLLLKERGCKVIGVTMSLFPDKKNEEGGSFFDTKMTSFQAKRKNSCYSEMQKQDIKACEAFCLQQGIEHHTIDCNKIYEQKVLSYFKDEYRKARTPNPCIVCNQSVKFGAMLEEIQKKGIKYDYFCTGHYAKIVQPQGDWGLEWKSAQKMCGDESPYMIAQAGDEAKDQSYFLYRVSCDVLRKVRFPLSCFEKRQVISMARQRGLLVAQKKESQDFMSKKEIEDLFKDASPRLGNFVDTKGNILGKHRGIEHYTVGQRRGLGIEHNIPLYVKEIDAKTNNIILAKDEELFSSVLLADDFVWALGSPPDAKFNATAKIRLNSTTTPVAIERLDETLQECNQNSSIGDIFKITFKNAQRAVTPGQSVVIYKDTVVLGGGFIFKAF